METLQTQLAYAKTRRRGLMRRVWYIFFMSFVTRQSFVVGVIFGAALIAFWRLVSITSIINNILATEVGQLPYYVYTSLVGADTSALIIFMVLLALGVRVVSSLIAVSLSLLGDRTWRPV
jgi:hypothetical protein